MWDNGEEFSLALLCLAVSDSKINNNDENTSCLGYGFVLTDLALPLSNAVTGYHAKLNWKFSKAQDEPLNTEL